MLVRPRRSEISSIACVKFAPSMASLLKEKNQPITDHASYKTYFDEMVECKQGHTLSAGKTSTKRTAMI